MTLCQWRARADPYRRYCRYSLFIERPSKYEFRISGYASNIYPDNWLSFNAQMRDIFEGDVGLG